MSEHPLDREMRALIDASHRRTEVLVGLANIVADARRLEEELALEEQLAAVVWPAQTHGGPLNGQAASVTGNGSYGNGSNGLAYSPPVGNGAPSPISGTPYGGPQQVGYSLREALQKAAVEQTPYPAETTYNPGVPAAYAKAYGYK